MFCRYIAGALQTTCQTWKHGALDEAVFERGKHCVFFRIYLRLSNHLFRSDVQSQ